MYKRIEEAIEIYHETKSRVDLHIFKVILFEISKAITKNESLKKIFNEPIDNHINLKST